MKSLARFFSPSRPDLFAKCEDLAAYLAQPSAGEARGSFRLEPLGPIDHHIRVSDGAGGVGELVCCDSDGYLGLHLDARSRKAGSRS